MPPTSIRFSQIQNVPLISAAPVNPVVMLKGDPTEATFTNSAAENTLWSYSLAGGVLGINDIVWFRYRGSLLNNSGGTLFYNFRWKYGATTLLSMNPACIAAATAFQFEVEGWMKNAGATNSQKGGGRAGISEPGNNVAPGTMGTSAIDSTVAQTIALTVQASAATATQTIIQQLAELYYLKNT